MEWISVNDKCPPMGANVLACYPDPTEPECEGLVMALTFSPYGEKMGFMCMTVRGWEDWSDGVTHWMLFPQCFDYSNTCITYVAKSERKDSRICNAKIGDEISYKKKTHKTVNAFTVGKSYPVINETKEQLQVRTNSGGCKWINKFDHFHAWELI